MSVDFSAQVPFINDASVFFSRAWAVLGCHLFRRDVIAQRQPTIFWQDTMNERLVCVCGCDFVCGFDVSASRVAVGSAGCWCCRWIVLDSLHSWTPTPWSHLELRLCEMRPNLCLSPQVSFGCGGASHQRTPSFPWEVSVFRTANLPLVSRFL